MFESTHRMLTGQKSPYSHRIKLHVWVVEKNSAIGAMFNRNQVSFILQISNHAHKPFKLVFRYSQEKFLQPYAYIFLLYICWNFVSIPGSI